MLSALDIIFIVAYFVIILIVGFLAGKKETNEGFLIADRKLNALSAAMTISASKIGAGLLLAYTALVYLYGLGAIWFFLGYIFGYIVFYFFIKKIKRLSDEKRYYTLSDFFFDKYGTLAGYLTAFIVFITMFGWVIVNFIGGAKILNTFIPLSFELSIIIIGLVILAYLIIGGFKATVRTDAVQFLGILLLFFLMGYLMFNYSYSLQTSDFNLFSIPVGQIINFFLAGLFFPLASAELWQRVYAMKDEKTLKKSLILASTFYIIIGVVLMFIGIIIRTKLAGIDPDTSLVMGFSELLPAGLVGVGIIVFYSAVMSSADTFLFTSASSLSQDFIARIKQLSKEKLLKVMKIVMAGLTAIAIVLSIGLRDIIDTTFLFVALTMSLGFLVMFLWIVPKLNKYSLNLALIFSFVGIIILSILKGISVSLVIYSLGFSVIGLIIGEIYFRIKLITLAKIKK